MSTSTRTFEARPAAIRTPAIHRRGPDGQARAAAAKAAGDLERAVEAHDAAVAARGLEIWIGNEPTFTDGHSQAPEWLFGALGEDKLRRAQQVVSALVRQSPGCALLRSIGRQYPGEGEPRWSFGLYAARDGVPVWSGPSDPLLADGECAATLSDVAALIEELAGALARRGFAVRTLPGASDSRLVFARPGDRTLPDRDSDPRLGRRSIHGAAIPDRGLADDLARDGLFLIIGQVLGEPPRAAPGLELPAVDTVATFRELLDAIGESARACALPALVLRGVPPPVDASVSLATVTPDPAVVEVNMAPHAGVRGFLGGNRQVFAVAAAAGLQPARLYYNGAVVDSGGGGQMTIGGPSPERSPCFVEPRLLPRLVRYLVQHPALSYLFAHDHVGPCGQSVRPDERGSDAFAELRLALALLAQTPACDPLTLWRGLAPFLTDPTGNSHRADLNIEKLWNPYLPGRGRLGLVELRGLRMQPTPEHAAALAALWRAVIARLMVGRDPGPLVDWGLALHDRFALPFYLEADLRDVLDDLAGEGLGLEPAIVAELAADSERHWATLEVGGASLTIRRGLEFWPLVGDASAQQGTSRLVDASTARIELTLRAGGDLDRWMVRAADVPLPMRCEHDAGGRVLVFGLRYRSFLPAQGLHPTLAPGVPLRLTLIDGPEHRAWEVALHEWRPDGEAYSGLPRDVTEARARRAARCVLRRLSSSELRPPAIAAPAALTPFSLDLRYPAGGSP
jgi:uncharacterized protein (DUF2126 family)